MWLPANERSTTPCIILPLTAVPPDSRPIRRIKDIHLRSRNGKAAYRTVSSSLPDCLKQHPIAREAGIRALWVGWPSKCAGMLQLLAHGLVVYLLGCFAARMHQLDLQATHHLSASCGFSNASKAMMPSRLLFHSQLELRRAMR